MTIETDASPPETEGSTTPVTPTDAETNDPKANEDKETSETAAKTPETTPDELSPQLLSSKLADEERLLDAYRELKKVKEDDLTKEEKERMKLAEVCQANIDLMKKDIDPNWNDLGESTSNYRYQRMAYKVETQPVRVDMQIESPVEESLILPLMATLNEVDLYPSWFPNWTRPAKFRVVRAETLKKLGKCSQVFTVRTEAPLATVEFYVNATVVDDTDSSKELVVNLEALEPGAFDGLVPPKEEKINRALLSGGLMFRKCPEEMVERSKALRSKSKKANEEKIVLMTLSVVYENRSKFLNANIFMRQMSKFMLRVVIGAIWSRVIGVAQDIRDGKRPNFEKVMKEKKEVYDWAKVCADKMVT